MTTNTPPQVSHGAHTLSEPGYQAFLLLRTVFTVAPILFGLDKFTNWLTDWPQYLAPWIDGILPGTAQQGMYVVGVIEVLAGILVAVAPRIGAWVVAAWLAGIIVNLLTLPGYYDVALRDFGLLAGAGAVALGLLAAEYGRPLHRPHT
ncbi:MAG: DoxX family membrane protein [Rhodococcus sp. (in: high G+C Gram-positive bacteria)]|nr:MAG: DoxX family membrane protein [Rhodococcus sp. (in: high G+C Gram-positive bacteria)]